MDFWGAASGLSGRCEWIVRSLRVDCQGAASGLSGSCEWIVRELRLDFLSAALLPSSVNFFTTFL